MANTSPEHKEKRSQKRKDRQERKRQRQERRKEKNLEPDPVPAKEDSSKKQSDARKCPRRKSLPGYMAKNADLVCKWLRNYMHLFCMVDDAQIGFLNGISRERRNELV